LGASGGQGDVRAGGVLVKRHLLLIASRSWRFQASIALILVDRTSGGRRQNG
jgi:hypothetical protein